MNPGQRPTELDLSILADGLPRALVGKYGWLFLCNAQTMAQLANRLRLSDRQRHEYALAFEARWEHLEALNIPYLFVPMPMKEVVYDEQLPDGMVIDVEDLPIDYILSLDRSSRDVIDLRPVLREAKRSADVFHKTDTHFSAVGGHFAYQSIARHEHCAALGIEPLSIERYPFRAVQDLRAGLADKEKVTIVRNRVVPHEPSTGIISRETAFIVDRTAIGEALMPLAPAPASYELSPRHPTRILERADRRDLPCAVVIGDSFMERVVPYLVSHFRRIVTVWVPNPPLTVIERESPDVVIHLMAERFLIRSPLMPGWEVATEAPVAYEPKPLLRPG